MIETGVNTYTIKQLALLAGVNVRTLHHYDQIGLVRLIETIDRTLSQCTKDVPIKDEELYKGFTPELAKRYRREAAESYGEERVKNTEDRIRGRGNQKWEAVKAEMGAVTEAIAQLMDRDPADPAVQAQVARHHAASGTSTPLRPRSTAAWRRPTATTPNSAPSMRRFAPAWPTSCAP